MGVRRGNKCGRARTRDERTLGRIFCGCSQLQGRERSTWCDQSRISRFCQEHGDAAETVAGTEAEIGRGGFILREEYPFAEYGRGAECCKRTVWQLQTPVQR